VLQCPELVRGKRAALIVSGGNASLDELRQVLAL
jgi:hypothetical protein